LSNIKIKLLSSYLYIDTLNLNDLSIITNEIPSLNKSEESICQLNQIESSTKTYQSSSILLNNQQHSFYGTDNNDALNNNSFIKISEENSIDEKSSINSSKENYDIKMEDTNIVCPNKCMRNINNSNINQMNFNQKNKELREKEKNAQHHHEKKKTYLSIFDSENSSSYMVINTSDEINLLNNYNRNIKNSICSEAYYSQNSQYFSTMNKSNINNNQNTSKFILKLKEGKMKKGKFCDKIGKYIWNGKLSTYWVILCENYLMLFSNWKWFINNNKSSGQKKDRFVSIF